MGLKEYKSKRKFKNTPEPEGKVFKKKEGNHKFYIQKHHASRLHYDFRLEMEGVLKSWAIPKGPSLNPNDKRLAVMVEDHPMDYGNFEGIIPKGNYGAGTVMLWDEGEYFFSGVEGREENEKKFIQGLKSGNLKFFLKGKKLNGEFALVKIKRDKENEWLLIKKKDHYAAEADVLLNDRSVSSGKTLEEIKVTSSEESVWHSPVKDLKGLEIPAGARKSSKPGLIKPMMATLIDNSFDSPEWIFEVKWDGYRAIGEVNYNHVELYSRNLLRFNEDFPPVVSALRELGIQAVFDGEVCVLDEQGISRFELIQNYKRSGKGTLVYYVFDLIYFQGYDLSSLPLIERKEMLRKILPENHPVIRFSEHFSNTGDQFFDLSKKQGLEGIIAKRAMSVYQAGIRGKDWLKIKNIFEQEAVIVGFTEPRGGRKKFGALILGVYERGVLTYIGHTGSGFNEALLQEIYGSMKKLVVAESPFVNPPKTNTPVTWIKPKLVCQVKFQEWTNEGLMRIPIFLGMREDKKAEEVTRELNKKIDIDNQNEKKQRSTKAKIKTKSTNGESKSKDKEKRRGARDRGAISARPGKISAGHKGKKSETFSQDNKRELIGSAGENLITKEDFKKNEVIKVVSGNELKFSNLTKYYWPEEKIRKGDLLEYYHKIAPFIIPYLIDRPQSLRRNPNGYQSPSFFQKDMPAHIPDWIETKAIFSESNDNYINYLIAKDEASLLFMVNLGCIEINPWLSRKQSLEFPDYIVIDLDPQDVPFEQVIEVAQAVKEVLDMGEITGFCKTSGSRGLHIYIPLGARYDYDQAKVFAEIIAQLSHQLVPDITSLERMPKKRKNKIYLDYLQNRKGQTLAAPYCVRPKPGATVSTPLEWEELKSGLHPSHFDMHTIFERVKNKGDLFNGVLSVENSIENALKNLGWM